VTDISEELAEKYPTLDSLERAPLDWIWNRYDQKRERLGKAKTRRPSIQARIVKSADGAQALRCLTHEAGDLPREVEGDGLSGVISGGGLSGVTSDGGLSGMTIDGESYAFTSVPALFAGRTPVTRARIPWSMPEASV